MLTGAPESTVGVRSPKKDCKPRAANAAQKICQSAVRLGVLRRSQDLSFPCRPTDLGP